MALTEGIKDYAGAECPGIDEIFHTRTDSSPRRLLLERSQNLEMMRRIKGQKVPCPKVAQVTLSAR